MDFKGKSAIEKFDEIDFRVARCECIGDFFICVIIVRLNRDYKMPLDEGDFRQIHFNGVVFFFAKIS